MRFTECLACVLFCGSIVANSAGADEQPADGSTPASQEAPAPQEAPASQEAQALTDADVAALVEQLGDNRFSKRQAASQQLAEAGKAAIGPLAEAALSDNREVSARAIDILKKHFHDGDADTSAAAKKSLEELAQIDNPGIARRAKDALAPKQDDQAPPPVPGGLQLIPGRGNAQIRIRLNQLGGAGAKRVTVKNVNGNKETDVQEGDKKIKIKEDAGGAIKMEVTEKKDGKAETKKYEAKDAADLKKNHPEAHKLYEQYSKQQGGVQIQGIQILPGQVPQIPGMQLPKIVRPAAPRRAEPDKAAKQFKEAIEQIKKVIEKTENTDHAAELKKAVEQLEAAQKQR